MNKKYLYFLLILTAAVGVIYGGNGDSFLTPNEGVEDLDFLTDLEKKVVIEVNRVRQDPAGYAKYLEDYKKHYYGKYIYFAGRTQVVTQEGVSAVNEAIEVLKSTARVPVLQVSRGISAAARMHVKDQGPTGLMNHNGTDNSTPGDRMNRFGTVGKVCGENIEYGSFTAREIVMQLIIDDGVPARSHRENIFNPEYGVVGVSFGPHLSFSHMCVIDFAGTYQEKEDNP